MKTSQQTCCLETGRRLCRLCSTASETKEVPSFQPTYKCCQLSSVGNGAFQGARGEIMRHLLRRLQAAMRKSTEFCLVSMPSKGGHTNSKSIRWRLLRSALLLPHSQRKIDPCKVCKKKLVFLWNHTTSVSVIATTYSSIKWPGPTGSQKRSLQLLQLHKGLRS